MDNREANSNPHPPACTCADCVGLRLNNLHQKSHLGGTFSHKTPTKNNNYTSGLHWYPRNFTFKQKLFRALGKISINLYVVATLLFLIWATIKAFSHQLEPLIGSGAVIISLSLFILSCALFKKYVNRGPSMKLTISCLILLLLIPALSGVQPISSYKDNIVESMSSNWNKIITAIESVISGDTIVGVWKNTRTKDTVEFTVSGDVIMKSGGYIITGRYHLIGKNVVNLDLEGWGALAAVFGADNWQYEISGDTMTVVAGGQRSTFTRVNSN